ncbi:hypothetical protein ACH4SP_25865 [Streptomyces sp. NPDC021093]|uniref:hypothetical protein n=1 Tax=Streptomyces sp. NPDC021093 TaxID=3365112 RepID=UPI003797089F
MEQETPNTIRLIASDDENPKVLTAPGGRYEVVVAAVVDSDLQSIADETGGTSALPQRPPRLCGSRTTCLAIVEIE